VYTVNGWTENTAEKKCPYFCFAACVSVCVCVHTCTRVQGWATPNRTCVVCGRIHFSLVPETNPVHTNKDDVIYQRFPAAFCPPPRRRCVIYIYTYYTPPTAILCLYTHILYIVHKYIYMYIPGTHTTRGSVKMRSMSSTLVHHLLFFCSISTVKRADRRRGYLSLSLNHSISSSLAVSLSISIYLQSSPQTLYD